MNLFVPQNPSSLLLLILLLCSGEKGVQCQLYANKNAAKFLVGAGIIGGLALFAKGYHLGNSGNVKYIERTKYIPVKDYGGSGHSIVHAPSYGYQQHQYLQPSIPPVYYDDYTNGIHRYSNAGYPYKPIVFVPSQDGYNRPAKPLLHALHRLHKNPHSTTTFVTNHIHNYYKTNQGLIRHKRSSLEDLLLIRRILI